MVGTFESRFCLIFSRITCSSQDAETTLFTYRLDTANAEYDLAVTKSSKISSMYREIVDDLFTRRTNLVSGKGHLI